MVGVRSDMTHCSNMMGKNTNPALSFRSGLDSSKGRFTFTLETVAMFTCSPFV